MIYQLFNADVKNEYISNVSNEDLIRSIFEKSFNLESELNKDIHDFNMSEMIQLFKGIKFENKNEVKNIINQLSNYINWSIDQGIRNNNVNPLKSIDVNDFVNMFV